MPVFSLPQPAATQRIANATDLSSADACRTLWHHGSMYYELAHLYDWPGSLDFAEKARLQVLAELERTGICPPARLVDLACGTGTLALALSEAGYEVLGIDLAEPMLDQARQKQAAQDSQKQLQLCFTPGDMRFFETDAPADAVLCLCDSLNHLANESELRATFLQVKQALRPGGLFLFDLNTLENYRTFWNGSDTWEGPNYRLKTSAHFDENLGQANVTFEVDAYTDAGELLHQEERVVTRYFNEVAVEKYLRAAGFDAIRIMPFHPFPEAPEGSPLKTFWAAHCNES